MSLRSSRRKLLWCALAPVLGLLLVELVVRMGDARAMAFPETNGNLFADVKDPTLMFVNRPDAQKVIRYDEGPGKRWSVRMRTNAQRFRGPVVEQPKPENVRRIVCLGDSHTWGDGVQQAETWPAQLQALAGPGVEVLNCGVNGYDTMQTVLWYERFVEPFDPDLVLLTFFPNDVNIRQVGKGDGAVKDRWIAWTHPRRDGFVRGLRDVSVAADLICDRVYRWRSLTARQDSWSDRYRDGDPGWERAKEALARLRERCEADGRELQVLLFPYLVPKGEHFESHEVLEVVAQHCAERGLACFNGEAALLKALDPEDPHGLRVSRSDFHANGKAYGAFAQGVAEWLATAGWSMRVE